jgi:hypothetical protein
MRHRPQVVATNPVRAGECASKAARPIFTREKELSDAIFYGTLDIKSFDENTMFRVSS